MPESEVEVLKTRLAEVEAILRLWIKEYDCSSFCAGECGRSQLLALTNTLLKEPQPSVT